MNPALTPEQWTKIKVAAMMLEQLERIAKEIEAPLTSVAFDLTASAASFRDLQAIRTAASNLRTRATLALAGSSVETSAVRG